MSPVKTATKKDSQLPAVNDMFSPSYNKKRKVDAITPISKPLKKQRLFEDQDILQDSTDVQDILDDDEL
jgi:hypothetical protein